MLVAAGVDPQMVEWFGRWRSESVRSYTEDARAQAPQAARIAGLVRSAAPCTPAPGAYGSAPRTPAGGGGFAAPVTPAPGPWHCRETDNGAAASSHDGGAGLVDIKKWVEHQLALADGEAAIYPLRLASGKMHVAIRRVLDMEPRSWATLCGWRFRVAPIGAVKRLRTASFAGFTACDNCRRAAARAAIALDGLFVNETVVAGPAGDGPPAPSTSSSSSSDEESDTLSVV